MFLTLTTIFKFKIDGYDDNLELVSSRTEGKEESK